MTSSPHIRAAAQSERDALKHVIAGADLALVGIGSAAVFAFPIVAAAALVPAVIRWRSARELIVQERLVEDPPRYDYHLPAQPEYELLLEASFDAADPIEEALLSFAHRSTVVIAWEDALIRATERVLGARERHEVRYVRERSREVRQLADKASTALENAVGTQVDLISVLNSEAFDAVDSLLAAGETNVSPEESFLNLPEPIAARLFTMGAHVSDFLGHADRADSPPLRPVHAFSQLAAAMTSNLETKRELSAALGSRIR